MLVLICTFFIFIGTTSAGNVIDNKNIHFENNNQSNNVIISNHNNCFNDKQNIYNQHNDLSDKLINKNICSNNLNKINNDSCLNNIADDINVSKDIINNTSDVSNSSKNISNDNIDNEDFNKKYKSNSSSKINLQTQLFAGGDNQLYDIRQSTIISAASSVYKYVQKYDKLPNYVILSGYKFTISEFLYLLSKTIEYKHDGVTSEVIVKYGIYNPNNPSGSSSVKGELLTKEYYSLAKNVISYIGSNYRNPNYVVSSLGNIQYQTVVFTFSKILYFFKTKKKLLSSANINSQNSNSLNKYMPSYFENSGTNGTSNVGPLYDIRQSTIISGASTVYKYVLKYGKLPSYVTLNGIKYSFSEFLYLLSKTVEYKHEGVTSEVVVKYGVYIPLNPSGSSSVKGELLTKEYYSLAKNVISCIGSNYRSPNYVVSSLGNIQYQTVVFTFSKILYFFKTKKKLLSSVNVNSISSNELNKYLPKYPKNSLNPDDSGSSKIPKSILNSKYNGESLTKYLNPSTRCQSTNSAIMSLAKSLTKNYDSDFQKATAVFNYVRDNIGYEFYYNSYDDTGAKGVLSKRWANCVDSTHLLIALCRASGIAARYANGDATFSSGSRYGHVWAQVLIGDTWVVADTTSSRNSFGVVNNWYPSSANIYGYYSSISF